MLLLLYFVIGLFASTIGAVAGLGGGVIIKPLLDLLAHFDLPTIGILSAATVLSMATISMINFSKNKEMKIDKVTSSIVAAGSIVGGVTGKAIFNLVVIMLHITTITAIIQSAILAGLLLFIYVYLSRKHSLKSFVIRNKVVIFCVGFSLGFLSAFLGIGGGPLNVAILCLLFSMTIKEAGINSIFIIFFSQLAALILVAFTSGYQNADLSMLYYMIPGGIIGGMIGSNVVAKLTNMQIQKIFNVSIIMIICINLYNIVNLAFS